MDEADRILNMDFEAELDKILKVIPKERNTYLYSATMKGALVQQQMKVTHCMQATFKRHRTLSMHR